MPTLEVINQSKKKVGTIELRDDVFAVEINVPLVHQVIKAQLASRRQGTAKTKVKSEVRGGGAKPFRQKGTGQARRGSSRSPLLVGGGQNFGPTPRCYYQRTPKEMVRGALRSALSDRVKSNRLLIIDELKLKAPKTKEFAKIVKEGLELNKVLFIDQANENLERAGRNLAHVRVLRTDGINVYDIVKHDWIVLTEKAAKEVQDKLGVRE